MRRFTGVFVLFMGLLILPMPLLAQAEIPSVTVTATDDSIDLPSEVPSGLVTFTFQNNRAEAPFVPLFGRLNDGVTPDDIAAAEKSDNPMDVLALVVLYGGSTIAPGESLTYTTELTPGNYALNDDPQTLYFTVTDSGVADLAAPESDVTLALVDFAFGVPSDFTAGPHVWHIQNFGTQWHEVAVFKVDDGTTVQDARDALMAADPENGDLPYGDPAFLWLPSGPNTQSWVPVDLEAGTYVVACFLPDVNGDFSPHMAHGMIQMFTVE